MYFNLFMSFTLQAVIEQGGLGTGGLNFDCKVRRESIALEDMFISHIGKSHGMPATVAGCAPPPPPPHHHRYLLCLSLHSAGAMDTFARALRSAARLIDEGVIPSAVKVTTWTLH